MACFLKNGVEKHLKKLYQYIRKRKMDLGYIKERTSFQVWYKQKQRGKSHVHHKAFISLFFIYIFYFSKSGLSRCVLSNDCWSSHSLIFASCPDNNTSGTCHPLYSAGRVYTGAANRLSWKESDNADCSSEMTPGIIRTTASAITAAANSPPVKT